MSAAVFTPARCSCGGSLSFVAVEADGDASYICRRCGDEWYLSTLRRCGDIVEGERIFRYVLTGSRRGCDVTELQPLTVIRPNRKTVTVETDSGSIFRLPYADVAGYYDGDDE